MIGRYRDERGRFAREPLLPEHMVAVPAEFRAIGYSGLFWSVAEFQNPADVEAWRNRVPCLLPTRGWMALSIVDEPPPAMIVVRTDMAAMWDLVTKPRFHPPPQHELGTPNTERRSGVPSDRSQDDDDVKP